MPTCEIEELINLTSVATVCILSAIADFENHPKLLGLTPEQSVLTLSVQKLLIPRLQSLQDGKPYQSPFLQ